MSNLVIVESPTKVKTIARFLGEGFEVKSSFGHIRDLPEQDLGVDVAHDFAPKYVVPAKAKKTVSELKKLVKKADTVYFASDEDREGEAISWHLADALDVPLEKSKRIVFHEITQEAISEALKNPRHIDHKLVDAQTTRRILDRLVGYELSPFLWRKVAKGLSAGRVQSAALRLIVEREREIQKFVKQEYWTIHATLKPEIRNSNDQLNQKSETRNTFEAQLIKLNDNVLDKFAIPNEERAKEIEKSLQGAMWTVAKVERKTTQRQPLAPFTTSTLQQEANRRLGFSAKQTMALAQMLYEGSDLGGGEQTGLITYMRTDSVNLAEKFLQEAGTYIKSTYGAGATTGPRTYTTRAKRAQEAHEAIRPTDVRRLPESLASKLDPRAARLYDLIWRRAVASQMTPAVLDQTVIESEAKKGQTQAICRSTGQIIRDPGYMRVWKTGTKESELPDVKPGESLECAQITPLQHFTEPPSRYSDAALVKALEERGIGRPSTYAPTISTIIERHYVTRGEGKKLVPTDVAMVVNDVLVAHFPHVVEYEFTARMEDDLDAIAAGEKPWVPVVRDFYEPFHKNLMEKYNEVKKAELTTETTDVVCEKCKKPMIIRLGRFGKFLACTGFPACRNTKHLNGSGEQKSIEPVSTGVKCPQCGEGDIVERRSHRGKVFFSCARYPDCKYALWDRPTGEKCPACRNLMGATIRGLIRCSNKDCTTRARVAKSKDKV